MMTEQGRQPHTRWHLLGLRIRLAWRDLSRRERRVTGGGVLLLSGLLVWWLLIQPPLNRIAYWSAEIPRLRSQNEALDSVLQQVSTPPLRADDQDEEQALRRSLEARGLLQHCRIEASTQGTVQGWHLTFEQAPADAMIDWLLEQPQVFSLHVMDARLQRAGAANAQDSAGSLSGVVRMEKAPSARES
ncbi:type II secretion system protein GspM [Pseudomonas cannabina]|uniref:Proteinral secretion pathway protein GspM n=3 Tax=Pseudomonas syringae group TaxID=136849 RepID=A0A3M3RAB0_PSECA|nr:MULTISPECIES: type II secretion system protein GspM [Pseudomonas syringae group]KPW21329.1 proteinral secretion pathway protein GspM [Pseudomonas cannabina pv. alisalensis]RMN77908.1 proteinral secretion pathway protein GspM [Pseudomonas cannabina]RMN88076.1 proteinral secretion pathway protein GspM [Pseudomonas cannabina pv. alisalensis]RMN93402.1 proteinral secretion pathway protein GspM [Pseudomonas cannabina]UBY98210.1 type II secretion system protein M [Pseudomonas cannabina pv. alisal